MTQKDKELLLNDLCARLSYKVKCSFGVDDAVYEITGINPTCCGASEIQATHIESGINGDFVINTCKPYLFPLSSMTEEQKKEYYSLADDVTIKPGQGCYLGIKIHCIKLGISDNPHEEVWDYIDLRALDWLNKNHFDYRGLIEKGLAIDCTNLNIY